MTEKFPVSNMEMRRRLGKLLRPSFEQVWMSVAHVVSGRGTCPRRRVGAVIVDSRNQIVSTGFNGAPHGLPHCNDVGCLLDDTGRCKRTAHAEANAILQAGKARTEGGTLFSTDFPCSECANLIIQAGIKRVYFDREYESQPELQEAISASFEQAGIVVLKGV